MFIIFAKKVFKEIKNIEQEHNGSETKLLLTIK